MAFERAVDVGEQVSEQLVVVAEFEELHVRVFEEVDNRGSGVGLVIDKGGGPADDGEVRGVVGERGAEDFVALGYGERNSFTANQLGDLVAMALEELGGGGGAPIGMLGRLNVDDEIVF